MGESVWALLHVSHISENRTFPGFSSSAPRGASPLMGKMSRFAPVPGRDEGSPSGPGVSSEDPCLSGGLVPLLGCRFLGLPAVLLVEFGTGLALGLAWDGGSPLGYAESDGLCLLAFSLDVASFLFLAPWLLVPILFVRAPVFSRSSGLTGAFCVTGVLSRLGLGCFAACGLGGLFCGLGLLFLFFWTDRSMVYWKSCLSAWCIPVGLRRGWDGKGSRGRIGLEEPAVAGA